MSSRARLILISCVLPTVALATPGTAKDDATGEDRPARTVTLEFNGPLREALKKIAAEAGISLIVTGHLEQPAEVMLNKASPEMALATVARLYELRVERQGNIWTVRPMTEEEREAARSPQQAREDEAQEEREARSAHVAPVPPVPPVPALPIHPVPPLPPGQGFQEEIERRVQERIHRKRMRGSRSGGNDVSGTGAVTVGENETVGDAVAFGGNLTVHGHVEGDAVAFGGDVILGEEAVVEGDAVAFGGQVQRAEGATVKGEITHFGGAHMGRVITSTVRPTRLDEDETKGRSRSFALPGFLLRFALMFAAGFLCMMFAPNPMRQLASELRNQPVRCALVGLVSAVALVPLTLALTITLIGIPVVLALWVLVCVGMVMGFTALASEIGHRLPALRTRKTQATMLAAGLLILLLVGMIPVLGPIALSVVGLLSLGAIIRTRFGTRETQGIPQPV